MEKNETALKLLKCLKELKGILMYTEKISLRDFFKQNKMNQRIGTILVNGGIVKNLGSRGRSAKFVWNSIEPNYKMAEEVLKRANNSVNEYKKEKRKLNKIEKPIKYRDKIESITKYQEGLIKLNHLLKYTSKISLSKFLKENNLSFKIGVALQELNVIENTSKSKKYPEYKWITTEPNYDMAKKLLEKVNIRTDENIRPVVKKVKTINRKDYSITKLLFGLIKIKTKYIYS